LAMVRLPDGRARKDRWADPGLRPDHLPIHADRVHLFATLRADDPALAVWLETFANSGTAVRREAVAGGRVRLFVHVCRSVSGGQRSVWCCGGQSAQDPPQEDCQVSVRRDPADPTPNSLIF